MKNIALALVASLSLFACSAPEADETGSSEAAYSFTDPPRAVRIDAKSVHVECTNAHGSFVVLTFEDRIFTAHGKEDLATCNDLREELRESTTLPGSLIEEHGAINRGTIQLSLSVSLSLESWGI